MLLYRIQDIKAQGSTAELGEQISFNSAEQDAVSPLNKRTSLCGSQKHWE